MPKPPPIQLIRSGPATGKTSYLVATVTDAILSNDISPVRVLALGLDRAAQQHLRQDFASASIQTEHSVMPVIATYESLAEQILQQSSTHLGRGIIRPLAERLLIGQTIAQTASQARYYRDERLRRSSQFRDDVADFVAELKRCKIDPVVFREQIIPGLPSAGALQDLADIYQQYQQRLQQAQVYDYRGIIWLALVALEAAELSHRWQQRYDLVVADDLQDATLLQLELLAAMCGPDTRLVGTYEPNQTIYRFRGAVADPAPVLQMLLPQRHIARESLPTDTSNSLPASVAAAAHRFAADHNLDSQPASQTAATKDVEVQVYRGVEEELVGIGDQIIAILQEGQTPPNRIGIIARRRSQAEAAVQHLSLRGIPVAGYDRMASYWSAVRVLTDIINVLVFVREGDSYPAAVRQRKLSAANAAVSRLASLTADEDTDELTLARICHHCSRQGRFMLPEQPDKASPAPVLHQWKSAITQALSLPPLSAFHIIVNQTGLAAKLASDQSQDTLPGLAHLLTTLEETDTAFAQVAGTALNWDQVRSAIEAAQPPEAPDAEGVAVLTAHGSRGREFDRVFLIGINEGSFPSPAIISRLLPPAAMAALRQRTLKHLDMPIPTLTFAGFGEAPQEAHAEETRLFYTCLTRARQRLVLTCHLEEKGAPISPSPFLTCALPADFALAPLTSQPEDFACPFAGLVPETSEGRTSHQNCPITICARRPSEPEPRPAVPAETIPRPCPARKAVLSGAASHWAASASSLNDYFRCPRLFFYGHLLDLESEEHDAMVYGSAIHNFLAELNALSPVQRTAQVARELLDKALADAKADFSSQYAFYVYQQQAQRSLQAYIQTEYFKEPSQAQEQPFTIELKDERGHSHLFTGRIDQVTPTDDGLTVVDYKSGSVDSALNIRRAFCYRPDRDTVKEPPANYQLPLYVLGWEQQQERPGQVTQVALHSFCAHGKRAAQRVAVELIPHDEPGDKQFSRAELEQIAQYLAHTARIIKGRREFEGHPPAEGCNTYFGTCPFILICSEAEPR